MEKLENALKQAGFYGLAGLVALVAAQMGVLLLAVGIALGLAAWLGQGWAFVIVALILLSPVIGGMIWLKTSQKKTRKPRGQEISGLLPGVPPAVDEVVRKYPLPVIAAGLAGGFLIGRQPQLVAAVVRAMLPRR